MKKVLILSMIFYLSINIFAQTDFEKYKKEQFSAQRKFREKEIKAFANYYNQQDSLFIQYKDKIERLWNQFIESTPKEWVSYNSDFTGRSRVNFKKNKIKVEAVVSSSKKSDEKAKDILKKQIISIIKEKDGVTNKPLLENQVITDGGKTIKKGNVKELTKKIIKKTKKIHFKNKNGKDMVRYEIDLNIVPNSIKIRLAKYKPYVEKFCKKFNIDIGLALAIIHTESFFNPKAYNRRGNAYGMMQIVPQYAGLTMNNYLFHKNRKPSASQLYNPKINLEMGIGYLHWLAGNKWKEVKNKDNRNYCIVCSYNGGVGSVYKAMTGRMRRIGKNKWNKMIHDLNTMDNEELYKKLRRDIPFEETRNYIKLVKEKMEKYYKIY